MVVVFQFRLGSMDAMGWVCSLLQSSRAGFRRVVPFAGKIAVAEIVAARRLVAGPLGGFLLCRKGDYVRNASTVTHFAGCVAHVHQPFEMADSIQLRPFVTMMDLKMCLPRGHNPEEVWPVSSDLVSPGNEVVNGRSISRHREVFG